MRVWVYPEKKMEQFGARRWAVEWWTLRPDVDPTSEYDFDSDLVSHAEGFKTHKAATARAEIVAADSVFGCATVQEQCVDWFVEEDRIAEWSNIGRSEEVMA